MKEIQELRNEILNLRNIGELTKQTEAILLHKLNALNKQLTTSSVSQRSELLSCDGECDWQLKGIQSNDYLECSSCKKRKAT